MSQAEVIEVLEKAKGKPLSRSQIAEIMKASPIRISMRIRKLLEKKEIKCIELDRNQTAKALGLKSFHRRTRFYYI